MNTIDFISDITSYMKYSKYLPEKNRREDWNELITRNKEMHLKKFKDHPRFSEIKPLIEDSYEYVLAKKVLPSMRSLQFAGKPIELSPARIFNCSYIQVSHPYVFAEIMFLLLSGTGVGYSVQSNHIELLPEIHKPTKHKRYLVADSIEGWADAIKELIYAYMKNKALPIFDFSDIRPKGERLVTSGGKAPGPAPLKTCLVNIQNILDEVKDGDKLRPIQVHDIICHIADSVLAGGIRRSALISLFDFNDAEMRGAKAGDYWELHPHRGRANNSAVINRNKITEEEFKHFWEIIKNGGTGEPGIFFTSDNCYGTNPCSEVALKSDTTGGQFCNLVTINMDTVTSQEDFENRVRAATIIGTLQASYTNFHYLREGWKKITEKEALLGVSMTGIASNNIEKLNLNLKKAVKEQCVQVNKDVAKLIDIKPSARITLIKPDGTSSLVLGTASGIHAWYNDYYVRRIRLGKNEAIYQYLKDILTSEFLEDEYFRPNEQAVLTIPVKAPDNAILRNESPLQLLERVKFIYENWILPGHNRGTNTHNTSVTISIKPDEWETVGNWLWENKTKYTGVSVLPYDGGNYIQAPFEDITKEKFQELSSKLNSLLNEHNFSLDNVIEVDDNTDLKGEVACGGGACEVSYL